MGRSPPMDFSPEAAYMAHLAKIEQNNRNKDPDREKQDRKQENRTKTNYYEDDDSINF